MKNTNKFLASFAGVGGRLGGPSTLEVPVSYAGFDTTQLNESVTEGFELKVIFYWSIWKGFKTQSVR